MIKQSFGGVTQYNLFTNVSSVAEAEAAWGREAVFTGSDNSEKVGMQYKYDNSKTIDYFAKKFTLAPAHSDFYGIDNVKRGHDILIWIVDVYRNAIFNWEKEYKYHGVKLWRYRLENHPQLDNATIYPPNAGFYQYGPSGVINITSAMHGVPIFVGKPHMLDAPDYMEMNKLFGI
eukprot:UN28670